MDASPAIRADPFLIHTRTLFLDAFICGAALDSASLIKMLRDEAELRLVARGCGVSFSAIALPNPAGWTLLLNATHIPDDPAGSSSLTVSAFGPFDAARQVNFLKLLQFGIEADLIRSAEELDAALHRCGELQQRTRDVCAFIAHDIGNAVSIATMSLQSIGRSSAVDDALVSGLDTANRSLRSIEQLAKSLDILTSMKSFPVDTIAIDEFLQDNENILKMAAGQNCSLDIMAGSTGCSIRVDPAGLVHALINLIFNSREAMSAQSEGSIVISTEPEQSAEGTYIHISVIDSGPGVSEAIKDHIFEPSVTTKAGSSGLGLPSVRSFCSSNGGKIEYQASQQGSPRFILSFPTVKRPDQIAAEEQIDTDRSPAGARILVVEDEPDALDVTVDIILSLGHHAQGVKSVWQAIRALASNPFDIILIDASLGRTAEFDLVQWIRLHAPNSKVCEMSGSITNFHKDQPVEMKILKPLSISKISSLIDQMTGK